MKVVDVINGNMNALEKAILDVSDILKKTNPVFSQRFLDSDIQIGMFFYSDQFSIGKLTLEMLKKCYDCEYHEYVVRLIDLTKKTSVRIHFNNRTEACEKFGEMFLQI